AFEGVDPELEDVARLLGRGELSVFLAVTLPLSWRGLAAGAMLAFTRALGDFGATLMVAGDIPGRTQTAALAIYDAAQVGDTATAGRLTLLVSLVAIAALVIVQWALPGRGVGR
ncbi:MAG: ABC transporter permease subunit, partial [Isosphaeraceae bacterium]|nr:ABC transporter permease subunit [Isosphaeraceae bacterium]